MYTTLTDPDDLDIDILAADSGKLHGILAAVQVRIGVQRLCRTVEPSL